MIDTKRLFRAMLKDYMYARRQLRGLPPLNERFEFYSGMAITLKRYIILLLSHRKRDKRALVKMKKYYEELTNYFHDSGNTEMAQICLARSVSYAQLLENQSC